MKRGFAVTKPDRLHGCSLEEFLAIDRHPVEAGIVRMIEQCDLVVDAVCSATIVQEVLRGHIVRFTGD